MKDFEKRLIAEYCQLRNRLGILEYHLSEENADKFKETVGEKQFELLQTQAKAMHEYYVALSDRLSDLKLYNKVPEYYDEIEAEKHSKETKELGYDRKICRENVLARAYNECMSEMYHKSQPSVNYNELVEKYRSGEINKDERIYEEHYLNQKEYEYILDKYVSAYGMSRKWHDYVDCVSDYFNEGATRDKWIPDKTDEDGDFHPGHRGYEKLPSIENVIKDILDANELEGYDNKTVANMIGEAIRKRIEDCKNFYRFDREEGDFRCAIALGASPTSSPDTVIKYWETQGKKIDIVEHDIEHLWEIDNDYDYSDEED